MLLMFVFMLVSMSFMQTANGATKFDYKPMENIPGFEEETTGDFATYVGAIYKFGIAAVGIAALLMITIGGYLYAISAGNTALMDKAKGMIIDAMVGLLLAMLAYLIMYELNPDLVKIRNFSDLGSEQQQEEPK